MRDIEIGDEITSKNLEHRGTVVKIESEMETTGECELWITLEDGYRGKVDEFIIWY